MCWYTIHVKPFLLNNKKVNKSFIIISNHKNYWKEIFTMSSIPQNLRYLPHDLNTKFHACQTYSNRKNNHYKLRDILRLYHHRLYKFLLLYNYYLYNTFLASSFVFEYFQILQQFHHLRIIYNIFQYCKRLIKSYFFLLPLLLKFNIFHGINNPKL